MVRLQDEGPGRRLARTQGRAEWPSEGETDRRWNGLSGLQMRLDERRRIGIGVSSAVGRWCDSVKALRRARVGLVGRAGGREGLQRRGQRMRFGFGGGPGGWGRT